MPSDVGKMRKGFDVLVAYVKCNEIKLLLSLLMAICFSLISSISHCLLLSSQSLLNSTEHFSYMPDVGKMRKGFDVVKLLT
ncbi:hypothetical protein IHE45_04G084700 [Dioscorea alata]|uniref:Uncharacterized protein n=1 Tax=Dioscorea alata TaxID=55571 RepID=A0ACB7WDL8_DIOAL|nr:hypothetical protein IHE45_04G084700 [Dioscorea alata]